MVDRQGVIFDVDGVLIDSYQSHFQSWRELASEIGRTYSEAEFVKGFGRTSRENILEQWTDRQWTPEEVRQLDDRKEWLYREIIRENFPAMPGAEDLIHALHDAGIAMAVGSSGPPENVDLVMEKLAVSEIMQCRVTARQVTRGKPDPQVFQLAAKGLGLSVASCCVIEDAPVGIQAAHSAGMICIGLASTGRTRSELASAECVVDSLDELTPQRISDLIRQGLR
jgi:beta-phosphoglucomutase